MDVSHIRSPAVIALLHADLKRDFAQMVMRYQENEADMLPHERELAIARMKVTYHFVKGMEPK